MTLAQYAKANPRCEVLPYFPFGVGSTNHSQYGQKRLIRYSHGQELLVPAVQKATETHHILGSSNGAKRDNHISNIIRVCSAVHTWIEAHKRPSLVLCCFVKREKGELDWEALSMIKGVRFPGSLEQQAYIDCCKPFPWIEEMRLALIEGRA